MKRALMLLGVCLLVPAVIFGCRREDVDTSGQPKEAQEESSDEGAAPAGGAVALSGSAEEIAASRGLSPTDIENAVRTYTPSGKLDDYVMFASGGHGGQVLVVGMPSMRLLKLIGVFTPEPWQGFGFGAESTTALGRHAPPVAVGDQR